MVAVLASFISKFQERSPLKSLIVRCASCLSPENIVRDQDASICKFKSLADKLFQAKHLSSHNSDAAKCQYEDFLTTVKENENDFMEYNFLDKNSRLCK